jgi:vitamin B12 transporter
VRIGTTLRGESKSDWDDSSMWPVIERKQLPGYGTVDLRADYALAKDWTVGAKIGNVLDKDYQTNSGYNQDGINGLVTLKYAPK